MLRPCHLIPSKQVGFYGISTHTFLGSVWLGDGTTHFASVLVRDSWVKVLHLGTSPSLKKCQTILSLLHCACFYLLRLLLFGFLCASGVGRGWWPVWDEWRQRRPWQQNRWPKSWLTWIDGEALGSTPGGSNWQRPGWVCPLPPPLLFSPARVTPLIGPMAPTPRHHMASLWAKAGLPITQIVTGLLSEVACPAPTEHAISLPSFFHVLLIVVDRRKKQENRMTCRPVLTDANTTKMII